MQKSAHKDYFHPDHEFGQALLSAWKNLQEPEQSGPRAAFRRGGPLQAPFQSKYYKILNDLKKVHFPNNLNERLPFIVSLVAHIKENSGPEVAKALAAKSNGERPLLSELRFRRLLQYDDRLELHPQMIRLLRMLHDKANVLDLSRSVFYWSDREKRRWAELYYTGGELPETETNQTDKKEKAK